MKIEPKNNCPINNFEPCRALDCAWFLKIAGKHPQTGEDKEEWACAIAWIPILTLEVGRQANHTGAAVESFRNEMVKTNETSQKVLMASLGVKSLQK